MSIPIMEHVDRIKGSKYFLYAICGILGISLLIIVRQIWPSGGFDVTPAKSLTPLQEKAEALARELNKDERFAHVGASNDPEAEGGIVISGEVATKKDAAALEAAMKERNLDYPWRIDVLTMQD